MTNKPNKKQEIEKMLKEDTFIRLRVPNDVLIKIDEAVKLTSWFNRTSWILHAIGQQLETKD